VKTGLWRLYAPAVINPYKDMSGNDGCMQSSEMDNHHIFYPLNLQSNLYI